MDFEASSSDKVFLSSRQRYAQQQPFPHLGLYGQQWRICLRCTSFHKPWKVFEDFSTLFFFDEPEYSQLHDRRSEQRTILLCGDRLLIARVHSIQRQR